MSATKILSAALIVTAVCRSASAGQPAKIPGVGPAGEVELVQDGFQFLEGPAWDGTGRLYFTDVAGNTLYKIERAAAGSRAAPFLEKQGTLNGLMIDAAGTIFACAMEGRLTSIDPATKRLTVLAGEYEGKRFNAPNDLVIDQAGGVYFTDPHFRAPMPLPQGKTAVYYRNGEGKVSRLIDDLAAPNGVILSPDEKTLYVIPSLQKEMMAYPVESPGKLGEGRVFCTLKQREGETGKGRGGDGLTIDTQGNLYIASQFGLEVFDKEGKALGVIEFPQQPSNATFGGADGKTLYVTARTGLYRVQMEATGHRFPGGKQ
ncbi:MAG: SMP-30/gluconolactonase/LRE family protein [Planctomycetales bacterium]